MAKDEKNISEVVSKEKPAKVKKEKKEGKIRAWFKGFRSEVKKVSWPTWKQVLKNSGVVIVIVGICAVVIVCLDVAFNWGFQEIVTLFTKLFKGTV